MFGRPTGSTSPGTTTTPPTQLQQPITTPSTSLLQSVSNRATGSPLAVSAPAPDSGYGTPSTSGAAAALSSSSPLHPSTNPASFRSLLGTHRAVVAMFTSATCAPCRMIEPVFEDLARSKKKNSTTSGAGAGGKAQVEGGQIAFVKVDLSVGMASMVAREYGVSATPTFCFFLDGK